MLKDIYIMPPLPVKCRSFTGIYSLKFRIVKNKIVPATTTGGFGTRQKVIYREAILVTIQEPEV